VVSSILHTASKQAIAIPDTVASLPERGAPAQPANPQEAAAPTRDAIARSLPRDRAEDDALYHGALAAAGYVVLPDRLAQEDRLLQAQTAGIEAWRDAHLAEADLIEAVGGMQP